MTKYRLSHYKVITDPIDHKGRRVLFSTRSGKQLIISKGCYEYLLEQKIDEIPQTILDKLTSIKAVVPMDEDELRTIVDENKNIIENSRTLYEVIQPSAMCQLGCYYCGQTHTKDQLNSDLVQKIEQRIRAKAATGKYNSLYIGWFGAEPLMGLRQIRELTVLLKKIASDFNLRYGARIVTNGLSLKENIFEELARDMSVDQVEVTLDGTAEFHDQHRYTKEMGNSFDLIFQNLKNILSKENFRSYNCNVVIRCNVDEKNYEGVTPLIEFLAKSGLQQNLARFYAIGIYSWGNDAHKKSLSKEEFAAKEIGWIIEELRNKFRPPVLIPGRVNQVCFSVSKTAEMYDAFGNIFDCSEVSYVPSYEKSAHVLGNLKKDTSINLSRSVLNQWNDTLLTDKFPCHKCEMLPVCGGGCPKSWHEDMRACPTNKFNIRQKLMMSYVLSQSTKLESERKVSELIALYPAQEWLRHLRNMIQESIVNDAQLVKA